jgi:hypothetical protein
LDEVSGFKEPAKASANRGLKMKRLIFVGVSLFLASGAFAQADNGTNVVDIFKGSGIGDIELADGRIYHMSFNVDLGEKADLVFGDVYPNDSCENPDRGGCATVFETLLDPSDGSFLMNLSVVPSGDYQMSGMASAEVTYPSLLGDDINARWTRVGRASQNAFVNRIVPPDSDAEPRQVLFEGVREKGADASATLVNLGTGETHSTDGFIVNGNFRFLNVILP